MSAAEVAPPLGPDDLYLYAHGNGAICLLRADARSGLVPLDEAVSTARAHHDAGGQIHLDHEDGALASAVVETLHSAGVPTVAFDSPRPPDTWPHGTDALMEAASIGADRLLDDLVERGADLRRTDDSGSTALHHAAMRGNAHAVETLVGAGADIDVVNQGGMTPRLLAAEAGHDVVAARLDALGASAGAPAGAVTVFPKHRFTSSRAYTLLAVVNIGIAITVLWPPSLFDPLILAIVLGVLWLLLPPFAYWSGGAPVRLDGADLSYQPTFGPVRHLDLDRAVVATSGGSVGDEVRTGARHLVIGHPDGRQMSARELRHLVTEQDDVEALLERSDRFVVVTVAGGDRVAVFPPLGAALAGAGTVVLPALLRQIADARRGGWRAGS